MSEVFTNAKRDAEDLSKVVNQTSGSVTNRTGSNMRALPVIIAEVEASRVSAQTEMAADVSAVDASRISSQAVMAADVAEVDSAASSALDDINTAAQQIPDAIKLIGGDWQFYTDITTIPTAGLVAGNRATDLDSGLQYQWAFYEGTSVGFWTPFLAGWGAPSHQNLPSRNAPNAHNASAIALLAGGSVQDAIKHVTPEMFGGGAHGLQSAIYAATLSGVSQVVLSSNTVYDMSQIGTLYIPSHIKLTGDKTSVLDFSLNAAYGTRDNPLISIKGSALAPTNITSFVAPLSKTIDVVDASGIVAGDLIEISEIILNPTGDDGWYDTSVGTHLGELHWVQSVSGNTITIEDFIFEKQGYSTSREFIATVKKIDYVSDVVLSGFTVKGKGRPLTGSGDIGVYFKYGADVHATNLTLDDVDKLACSFVGCINFSCDSSLIKHPVQGANEDTNYSIIPTSSSRNGKISNNTVYNSRHGVVTSHISSASSEFVPGVSRFIQISGNHVHNTWHAGISTHSDAEHYEIFDNVTYGCKVAGFDIRERNMKVYDNTAHTFNVGHGFLFRKNPTNLIANNNKTDGTFRVVELDSFRTIKNISINGVDYADNVSGQTAAVQILADTGALRGLSVKGVNVSNFIGGGGNSAAIRIEGDISRGCLKDFTVNGATNSGGARIKAKNFVVSDGEIYNVGSIGIAFTGITLGDNVQYSRVTTGGYTTRQSGTSNVDHILDNIDLGAALVE